MTDGQTDGRTEFSSLYRVCITCSAVKMAAVDGSFLIPVLVLIARLHLWTAFPHINFQQTRALYGWVFTIRQIFPAVLGTLETYVLGPE